MKRSLVVGTTIILVGFGLFLMFVPVFFWFNAPSPLAVLNHKPPISLSAYRSLGCAAFGIDDSLFVGPANPQGGYLRLTCQLPELVQ